MNNRISERTSASRLLESVLEDMNNIMKVNEEYDYNNKDLDTNINDYDDIENGNNNCCDLSVDKRFELMVTEMQNCLKDTADVRNIVQNISSDRRDFFTNIFKPEIENNLAVSHKVDLMDEISRQKLDIAYLQRDKQSLLNQITDLNNKVSMLMEENRKLKQELNTMKIDELDYCIPPNETGGDNISNNDSHVSKESGISAFIRNDSPMATSTPDKSKSPNGVPVVPLHANQRTEVQQRALPVDFLHKISPDIQVKESSGKSSSWSELRSNQVIQDEQFPTMTPPSHRKNSVNNPQIATRNRSFGKNESKIYSADNKRKMKLLSNKSNGFSPLDLDGNLDFSMSSQPVSPNINALALLAVNERLGSEGKFSRNSPLRMTAGPRLLSGHNKLKQTDAAVQRVLSLSNPNLQTCIMLPCKSDFKLWSKDHICAFMHQIGLGSYANNCRMWLEDGLQLIQASRKEIEKELGINNKLHLKKLLIHIRQLTSMHVPAATYFSLARSKLKIAANFNTRLWLDDIGLLHYMSLFSANCVDGYMLDQISLEDLQHLKIHNELHSLSLKRGIQLLREIDYDLSFLIRRPTDDIFTVSAENGSDTGNPDVTCNIPPGEVCRWTQHQVMEWLRRIELPEYASNIRGSGIHGALLILEDRFNASSLASVLNIPKNRSLLRRHLKAKFQELIGPSVVAKKKAAAEHIDFVALTTTSKIKYHKKKSFFSVIKRKPIYEPAEELLVSYSLSIEDLDLKINQDSMIQSQDN